MTDDAAPGPPLKILRVIARLNIGGPARHVVLLDEGLRARGHDTLLVHGAVGAGEGSLEHFASERRVPVLKIPQLGRRISLFSDVVAFGRLVGVVFRQSPDVIHTHTAKAGTLGRLAALVYNATRGRTRRCLVVHTFHGHVLDGYFRFPLNSLVRLAERFLAVITDRIVTISPAQRDDIVGRWRVAAERRTVVIPLGLDLDSLLELSPTSSDLRTTIPIPPNVPVVGFIGRLVPIKDPQALVAGIANAIRRVNDLRLLVAGDGPLRAGMEDAVRSSGIAANVHFLGWTEELARFYATIDVLALSSLNEGTPVAIIEAMAAGKPVVATAVGGVPDVVSHEATGLLVPAGDAEALGSALMRLASDAAERQRMGQAGRERARQRYSHRRLVSDINQMYAAALGAKRK